MATQGGAEASVHAARRLAQEFGEDPGKIMLKVDFSNAFNMVDRTEMLAHSFQVCTDGSSIVTPILRICSLVRLCCKVWLGFNKARSTIFARVSPFGTEDPGYVSKLESVRVVLG